MAEGKTPLTFLILDEDAQDAILHISEYFGYQETDPITGEPTTETRAVYAKRKIAQWLMNIVEEGRRTALERDVIVPPIDITPEP